MTVPRRTRSDLKAAGRSMAIEAVDAIAQHVASLTPEEMADNSRIDALTARAADAAVNVAETYLEAGIPAPWVKPSSAPSTARRPPALTVTHSPPAQRTATQGHPMPSIETIRRMTVQYRSEGADKVRSDADAVAAAQTRMGDAAEAASVTTEAASRRTLSAASAYDRLLAKVDPMARAQQALERATRTVDRAFDQAAISATEHARTLDLLQGRYGSVAAAAQRSARDIQAAWRGLGDQGAKVLENIEATRRLGSLSAGGQIIANENRRLEWAPDDGHDQAAVLTVCWACCSSNCTGLR